MLKALDKGRMTLLILLDFSKAFDTISHKVINSQTEISYLSIDLNRSQLIRNQELLRPNIEK
jgi:hypothetical protein